MNLLAPPLIVFRVHLEFEDGVLTIEGEFENVAAIKLAMELAAAVPRVTGIVDAVRDALLQESGLPTCTIKFKDKGRVETLAGYRSAAVRRS